MLLLYMAGIQNTVLHFLLELRPIHNHQLSRNVVRLDRRYLDFSTLAEVLLKLNILIHLLPPICLKSRF